MKIGLWFLIVVLSSSCAHLSLKQDDSASLKKAQTLYDLGEVEASIATLKLLVERPYNASHDQAYELLVEWLLQLKRFKEAKVLASYFLDHHQQSPSATRIVKLFDQLDDETKLSKDTKDESPTDIPLMPKPDLEIDDSLIESKREIDQEKLGSYYFHLGDFKKCLEIIGPDPTNLKLKAIKQEIEEASIAEKTIGVLLPLSGSFAPFGKKTLAALGIAWNASLSSEQPIYVKQINNMKVVIADTKGDAKNAALMAKTLIKDHKVSLIIGEITNEPSLSIAKISQQFSVPMLSLSRHPTLTALGKYIFVFNSSPNQHISYLVDQAIKNGHKKFGILFPKHNYGMSMSKLFFDEVLKKGGQITAIENYDTHETMFFDSVKRLVGTYYKGKPLVEFDALFIPEFQKLSQVIPALVAEDILVSNNQSHIKAFSLATKTADPKYVQLLGADSWNDKNLLQKLSNVDGAFFVDSISFENSEIKSFADNFLSLSGFSLQSLDIFAHDAAKLAEIMLRDIGNNRSLIQQKIAQFNGKVGLLDSLSFLPNGELNAPTIGFNIINGQIQAKDNG
jgi:branched-chain amino acid transport system substrate-binding protein